MPINLNAENTSGSEKIDLKIASFQERFANDFQWEIPIETYTYICAETNLRHSQYFCAEFRQILMTSYSSDFYYKSNIVRRVQSCNT